LFFLLSCNPDELDLKTSAVSNSDLYNTSESIRNYSIEDQIANFQRVANLDYLHSSEIELRDVTTYSPSELIANVINTTNFVYSNALFASSENVMFSDSVLVPKQVATFNLNSAAYTNDMVEYIVKIRSNSIPNNDKALTYLNLNEGPMVGSEQKFSISTIFGVTSAQAAPAYPWPDITYQFNGGNRYPGMSAQNVPYINTTTSVFYHLERAVNNKYGLSATDQYHYYSNFENKGVFSLEDPFNPNQVFPGSNPSFVIQNNMTELKRNKMPSTWSLVFEDENECLTQGCNLKFVNWHHFGLSYTKNDAIWFYNHALTFFNDMKPANKVFINCEMFGSEKGYTCLCYDISPDCENGFLWEQNMFSSSPITVAGGATQFYKPLVVPLKTPLPSGCFIDPQYPRGNGGSYGSQYYGVYAKLNIRPGGPIPIDPNASLTEPDKSSYY